MYKRGTAIQFVILILIILILIGAGVYLYSTDWQMPWDSEGGEYQAVFITGDQVYFGKLSNERSAYPTLRDIYYLQVNQPIQPIQTDENGNALQQPDLQLVKFGNELHGPSDEMRINRDHILLIEDLRENSPVVQAIREYQENQ